jgi:hypothetical protein
LGKSGLAETGGAPKGEYITTLIQNVQRVDWNVEGEAGVRLAVQGKGALLD